MIGKIFKNFFFPIGYGKKRLYYIGMRKITLDFRSDTVTKPTREMYEAMMQAPVGDDVYGEDPTVIALEELGATITGKDSALFLPSGTMGNLTAVLTHCGRGDEIILEEYSHIFLYEVGGMAALGGVMHHRIPSKFGSFDPQQVENAIRPDGLSLYPETKLICVENTHNYHGGRVVPEGTLQSIDRVAKDHNLKVHTDGARIWNASVATGKTPAELLRYTDSAMVCLSKGLGAPVGSLLVGDKEFIAKARRQRKMVGGGMRQAGVIAAAGIVALQSMIDRLANDHKKAKAIAEGLAKLPKVSIDSNKVETNILIFQTPSLDASQVVERFACEFGIGVSMMGPKNIRIVTHKDIPEDGVGSFLDAAKVILG